MAGHSKWAQIKHKKSTTDAKKGQLFSKLVREITVAAKSGGVSEDANPRLKSAIEKAKSYNLPKDNIERAILRAGGEGEEEELQEFLYEVLGPFGSNILIEGITDNKNRSLAETKTILNKYDAKITDPGSVIWNFEKIGVIEISLSENSSKTKEELELTMIDSGARDLKSIDDLLLIETNFVETDKTRQKLEALGIKIQESGYDFKPKNLVEISDEDKKSINTLINELLEHDDVQEVYTNLNNE